MLWYWLYVTVIVSAVQHVPVKTSYKLIYEKKILNVCNSWVVASEAMMLTQHWQFKLMFDSTPSDSEADKVFRKHLGLQLA